MLTLLHLFQHHPSSITLTIVRCPSFLLIARSSSSANLCMFFRKACFFSSAGIALLFLTSPLFPFLISVSSVSLNFLRCPSVLSMSRSLFVANLCIFNRKVCPFRTTRFALPLLNSPYFPLQFFLSLVSLPIVRCSYFLSPE